MGLPPIPVDWLVIIPLKRVYPIFGQNQMTKHAETIAFDGLEQPWKKSKRSR